MDLLSQSYGRSFQEKKQMFDWNTCKNIADFFADIVDYKSPFTSRHSIGVAEKAAQFAKYIG